ncbi:3-dehydroquinate synthase II family protein [Desulfolutivibrio sp.]|uniref:3-dehydroquinate synthase II family protein n=1 Tax=Desulfolutivibrio sp. TaxID=2773296 RepID=UPI002F96648B
MSKEIWAKAVPFDKKFVTLALESGVDAILADDADVEKIQALGRVRVVPLSGVAVTAVASKADEEEAVRLVQKGETVFLARGCEIIPVENILAQGTGVGMEAASLAEAKLAAGILERGVDRILVLPEAAADLKQIVAELKISQGTIGLSPAVVTEITPVGLGHRVCVDTISMLRTGQGMLVGNSSAFTFLVHAETESNPYVAARPFRINAGAVHAYAAMPGDKTRYLEELAAGDEVLIVSATGETSLAVVGRVKVEVRPMLLVAARIGDAEGKLFLQNAETIRLVRADGSPVSVVALRVGDEILCRTDVAGRHFGMRIAEDIKEG